MEIISIQVFFTKKYAILYAEKNNMKNFTLTKCADILKTLGNVKRLEILYILSEDELSVGQLERAVKLSQSALSQHLAILRKAKIVKTRRSAQTIFYSLSDDNVRAVLNELLRIYGK